MAHPIADMLLMSRRAAVAALKSGDENALAQAVELAYKVITHPSATNFFQALAAAVSEADADDKDIGDDLDQVGLFGDDPDIEDNGEYSPIDTGDIDDLGDEEVDEDSDASNPADEGLVNHDEEQASGRLRIETSTLKNSNALPWIGPARIPPNEGKVVQTVVKNFRRFT